MLYSIRSQRSQVILKRFLANSSYTRYDPNELRAFTRQAFEKLGLPHADAFLVAQCLVSADLRNQAGHGVQRIPVYADRLRAGIVNAMPKIKVVQTTPCTVSIDGDDGMGFIVATRATEEAISIARTQGIGLAGVKNSTHFGCSSHYVQQALDENMISLVFTNSSPALPPHGGARALLGANPFAAGVPGDPPFLLDMSTTVIARGKLRLMSQRGEKIPSGVGLDTSGRLTRDGMEAFHGVTLPFGGVKGAAISLLMDILCGVLTGTNFGGQVRSLYNDMSAPQNVGHFILCIRPDVFMPMEAFKDRMSMLVDILKSQPLAEGFEEVLIPGETETKAAAENLKLGVPLQQSMIHILHEEGQKLGLVFPEKTSE